MEVLERGIYKHYKGTLYKVLYIATHTETEEPLVIYTELVKPTNVWARPLSMFVETIEKEGKFIPRFEYKRQAI